MFNGVHRALFMHLRTVTLRRPGECRGHQPWVGVAVIRAIRRAHRHLADPWKTRTQLSAVEHLQIEAETLAAVGIVLQGVQIVEAAGEFQVSAALIFTVDADQLWQLRPDRMRPLRQWQLRQRAALSAHAAVVHTAGMRAAKIPFQQRHAATGLAEKQRCGGADDTAANDHCVDVDHASISRPNGNGLIGACARSRPISETGRWLSRAMISAAAVPHMRP
ncbi:hypothetical protein D3C71_390860 [compost metagenome]